MMKNLAFLLPGIFLFSGCHLAGSGSQKIDTPSGYELIWADEFDQDGKPDDKYWSYENGFVRNNELQWYQSQNANIKNGILVIEGKREQVKNPDFEAESDDWRINREFSEYTSACIKTVNKFTFQYGIMEVKARIDTSCGSWPAIWTLGVDRNWPSNGEVDMMEFYLKNGDRSILANVARGSEDQPRNAVWDSNVFPLTHFLDKDPKWPGKFHTWKMEWTKDFIKLYLDDELLNETDVTKATYKSGFNPFRQPHYVLLNLGIGSNGGDPSNTNFPITYEVDYVRVFQKKTDQPA